MIGTFGRGGENQNRAVVSRRSAGSGHLGLSRRDEAGLTGSFEVAVESGESDIAECALDAD